MVKQITIYRTDFNNNKDSEGVEYFDYILQNIGIKNYSDYDSVDLTVIKAEVGNTLNGQTVKLKFD